MRVLFLGVVLLVATSLASKMTFAKDVRFMTIVGQDRADTVELEETAVLIREDAKGGLASIKVVSEANTVNETYTLQQLRSMRGSPIKYKYRSWLINMDVNVLTIDGQNLTSQGGTLVLRYFHNVTKPRNGSGVLELEIERHGRQWFASVNDQAGRRPIQTLHLVLNTMMSGVPIGVGGVIAE
ncbi:MAG: hypothetical protein A2428_12440 [Bdellovibrionales bacterium RIFOXYC1_FULL_54_43]|nr:MAG: hypothetical protein A2428_12440 [Bdellovibrionales bacterium RIFOXYC1_FULL_54_43]OFZ80057.1 MAG: hypothetical protein A2603_17210 [Bdellovibrionales bacterium RIFOXYD1_FULL_55_31]